MKTKKLEQFILAIAVLLIITTLVIWFSGSMPSVVTDNLHYVLVGALALYVGYVYIVQSRDHRLIDGLEERVDELKHKVADREATIAKQKKTIDEKETALEEAQAKMDKLDKEYKKAQKDWKAEKEALEEKIAAK